MGLALSAAASLYLASVLYQSVIPVEPDGGSGLDLSPPWSRQHLPFHRHDGGCTESHEGCMLAPNLLYICCYEYFMTTLPGTVWSSQRPLACACRISHRRPAWKGGIVLAFCTPVAFTTLGCQTAVLAVKVVSPVSVLWFFLLSAATTGRPLCDMKLTSLSRETASLARQQGSLLLLSSRAPPNDSTISPPLLRRCRMQVYSFGKFPAR